IRPLAYCAEEDISRYANVRNFPLIPCNLCGSQPNLQRQAIKAMLTDWKKKHPGRIENIFRAIGHVSPSQLADHELFDFIGLGQGDDPPPSRGDWLLPDHDKLKIALMGSEPR
ncbi:MAG: tRNA 2-thiocytidine(32) synthetase TtcA, partial [Lysobacterales bacterium]